MKHSSRTLESGFVILPVKWATYVLLFLVSHDGGCRSTWPMVKRTRRDWGSGVQDWPVWLVSLGLAKQRACSPLT